MINFGIVTANRPNGVSYWKNTIAALVDGLGHEFFDGSSIHIFPSDEPVDSECLPHGTFTVWKPRGQNLVENMNRALGVMANKCYDAEYPYFCLLQDDLVFSHRFAERVIEVVVGGQADGYGMVSFYTPYGELSRKRRHAVVPYPPGESGFYGELACLWNAEAATGLVNSPLQEKHKLRRRPDKGHDILVQKFFVGSDWSIGAHNPCLVQHVGDVSSIGNNAKIGQRTTMNFAGIDYDAVEGCKR